ncbi:MAG: 50S ribosomal protein L37ae [Candidatus Aenigmatarchaeota archaeon]|nr:MAG: 50S ribosomal protein L37ae [Candidatus Aenigmarchaeota archaeon]
MPAKKIGSAGRFGSRYGRKLRKDVSDIEAVQRAFHECSSCRKVAVKRVAFGIWQCRSCNRKFAGGAFKPQAHPFKETIQKAAGA